MTITRIAAAIGALSLSTAMVLAALPEDRRQADAFTTIHPGIAEQLGGKP